MSAARGSYPPSPWPRRWAVALLCVTFPLVWWGAFVTATGSGMAFREWLTPDGRFMPFYPWLSSAGDKFIEHGHRLLAIVVGCLTICLVAVVHRVESSHSVRRFSWVLLAGVIAQGIVGGLRVVMDERALALVHGCIGPLFFAGCAVMAAIASPSWGDVRRGAGSHRPPVRLALAAAACVYLQLVLGAAVRHSPHLTSDFAGEIFQTAVYGHVIVAGIVVVLTGRLAAVCRRSGWGGRLPSIAAGLSGLQILLGASSWMVKYGAPGWATRLIGEMGHYNRASDAASAVIVTLHGAVGALILAATVVLAVSAVHGLRIAWSTPRAARAQEALA